jgi:sodium/proline symporter
MLMQRFGLSYTQALYLGTAIIMLYTLVGGFFAVSWTDFFQGILMLLCLLIIPWFAIKELGGWSTVFSMIDSTTHWAMDPFNGSTDFFYINLLAWGLGYFGQPHILVRYMAIKSTVQLPLARRIAMSWMTLSMLGAVMTGWVGIAYFKPDQIVAESIFIAFSQVLLSPWLAGILLAAILSSIMCALDSQMLASASALTEDIYRRLLRPQATQAELIWLSRIAIVLIAGIAMALAFDPNRQVIELVAFAWAGLGAAFGPAVLWSLFWRRMTARGALYGIVVGALTVVLWHSNQGGIFELYAIIPGFVLSSLAILLGSGLDNPPATHITQQFDLAWDKINNYK